ncbi:hypothetical protein Mal4_18140 [Maioricimonas rarisocia]|uniref:Uncharacterized protein n=1 Tax=Maioricimonas rarisocia TaxID=2528026 RepID=A0A517Z4U7_9PLAN|nr:hypothetical protein Mal4_18140 [Maioricimonas rarisocia]
MFFKSPPESRIPSGHTSGDRLAASQRVCDRCYAGRDGEADHPRTPQTDYQGPLQCGLGAAPMRATLRNCSDSVCSYSMFSTSEANVGKA